MSEGDACIKDGMKTLEEIELQTELARISEQNMLPSRIVHKIGEKINTSNIKITKDQLYRLVEKIQAALRAYTQSTQSFEQSKPGTISQVKNDKNIWNEPIIQNTDMKKLIEEMENLNKRMKVVEENKLEGVKGITGNLVKAKDIRTIEPGEVTGESLQPLEQIPNDPESIVVIMKWLQYLVDKTGKNNLPDILGYYVDIGWISDNVRLDLIGYSKGLIEDLTPPNTRSSYLPTRDHLQSLLFIQKLKGIQLDDRFIGKIERDLEKMAKSLEDYQIK